MACCLYLFSGDPVPGDARAQRLETFQISMADGMTHNQPVCCLTYLLPCCAAYYTRYRVLDADMTRYACCQGYMDNSCCHAGSCHEKDCPYFCLCVESCLCVGPSMSSSRIMVMDQYGLRSDPCDNRLVRLTNCLQIMSCTCDILALCVRELRHLAHIIHVTAQIVFYTTLGCMAAQVNHEYDFRKSNDAGYQSLPAGDFTANPVAGVRVENAEEKTSKEV